jgi:hypothetical protein
VVGPKGLGQRGGLDVDGRRVRDNNNNNNWNDNDNPNNGALFVRASAELLSPPFLPLPNALYPPAKHASYLIEPLLEGNDLL